VVRYEDARQILWECGYGAVRTSDTALEVYELNPGSTFEAMENDGFQRFKSLYVPEEHRKGSPKTPVNPEDSHFVAERAATLYIDEGAFSDVMGEEKSSTTTRPWDEIVDGTHLYDLVCRRIDPVYKFKGSEATGRGRNKSDWCSQYFELMEQNAALLCKFGIHLYKRKGDSWRGEVESLERVWPQGGHGVETEVS
jgi:hypothetical protein